MGVLLLLDALRTFKINWKIDNKIYYTNGAIWEKH
jgi:hypothetical protein